MLQHVEQQLAAVKLGGAIAPAVGGFDGPPQGHHGRRKVVHVRSHARRPQKHLGMRGLGQERAVEDTLSQLGQAGAGQLAQSSSRQSAERSQAAGDLVPAGGGARILVHESQVAQAHGRHPTTIACQRAAELHRSNGVLARAIGALTPCNRRVARTPVAKTKGDGTVEDLNLILLTAPGHSTQLVDLQEEFALVLRQHAVKPAGDTLEDDRVVIHQGARAEPRACSSDLGGQAGAVATGT